MQLSSGRYYQRGERYANLANAISGAIRNAIDAGMPVHEAACVAAQVAADYARGDGGERGVIALAGVVCARGGVDIARKREG